MLDPRIIVVVQLMGGAWWGLTVGLLDTRWDSRLAIASAGFGLFMAALAWVNPRPSARVAKGRWRDLRPGQRRDVARAVAHGTAVSNRLLGPVTAEVAEALLIEQRDERQRWRRGARLLLLCATVVAAAVAGAPAGWVAAGTVLPAAMAAFELYTRSDTARRRLSAARDRNSLAVA